MLKRLLTRLGVIYAPRICFYGPNNSQMISIARTIEHGRYSQPEMLGLSTEILLEIDGVLLNAYIPGNILSCYVYAREGVHYFRGIVYVVDTTNAEHIRESREEIVDIVRDTKRSLQPILILISTADASSNADKGDVIAECNLRELIAKEKERLALFTYSLPSTQLIEGFRWLVKKSELYKFPT